MKVGVFSVNRLYARALLQGADRRRIEIPAELRRAVEDNARLPLALLDRLWDAYCRGSGDRLAGLRLGLELQAGHLDSAGLLLATCDTLGEALEQLVEVAPIVGEGGDFLLARDAERAVVCYRPHLALRRAERVEAVLAGLLRLSLWASGEAFRPIALRFAHQPLAAPTEYRALLGIPASFGASDNALVFDAEQLDLALIQANAPLRDHLRELTQRMLAELGQHSLGAEVQRLVRANPRWGKERVASMLAISGRHLNRRLAEEGASFKLLRDAALRDVAVERLRGTGVLPDIADDLGFSDESAFAKAFRRWTGLTPAQFRRQRDARLHPSFAAAPPGTPNA
ncbi:MAG: AraC family transcriptional regulator ligand-binding domain-containing protein [Burkholderiaceae bacterium]|jgi:AraC-like DNA-binding protein|nr:AraC family transcriptional regulator ligand-binding domain-containing protein [Burkholderiaceae bacterium]